MADFTVKRKDFQKWSVAVKSPSLKSFSVNEKVSA